MVFAMYYLWLSPGNLFLIPGCDIKYFPKSLAWGFEHAAAAKSTIFSLTSFSSSASFFFYLKGRLVSGLIGYYRHLLLRSVGQAVRLYFAYGERKNSEHVLLRYVKVVLVKLYGL